MAKSRAAAWVAVIVAAFAALAGAAWADQPRPWQLNLQEAASPVMESIQRFHTLLIWIIFGVSIFVLALLIWVMVRYNARANPTPSKTTHNTLIEVVWTVVPIMILVVIAVPSFRLLYFADRAPQEDLAKNEAGATLTIKARGHQWYWSYVYESSYKVDDKGFAVKQDGKPVDELAGARFVFESRLVCKGANDEGDKKKCADFEAANGRKPVRLLDVDNPIVVPIGTAVRVLVQGMDVIHSWTVPAMGAKVDANPGRINETWFKATKTGIFYGQCSELCGAEHGFMPITLKVVSRADYDKWLAEAKGKFDKVEEPKRAEAPAKK
jgi:cytochrome c oxidase subunit II